jgi:two-component system sensor histidine kinase BaeS
MEPAVELASAADADLVVFDDEGQRVWPDTGSQPGTPGQHGGPGSGNADRSGSSSAPVLVGTTQVGTVRVVYGTPVSSTARSIAWWWIAVAALGALALALVAAGFVTRRVSGPLSTVAGTARAFTAGDRSARTGMAGSGEIADVARALDEMADEVVESERNRRRAAADVAHELRTPLAALQAGLEEARDGLVPADATLLAGLHDQTLRLGRIVADLAALSAAEGGTLRLRRTVVDLSALARGELAAQEARLRAADLGIRSELDTSVLVHADEDRLRQVVDNLLSNAARYCRPGDQVTVLVLARDGMAVLEVTDSGPGISAEDLPHVFERLWRGRGADRVGGSGIGLAVVKELVHAHGGRVLAESDGSSWTTLRVELPLLAQAGPHGP